MVIPLSDGLDIHFTSLHKILRNLYDQMTPITDDIATFATAVAGLGALLYISYRVCRPSLAPKLSTYSVCCDLS